MTDLQKAYQTAMYKINNYLDELENMIKFLSCLEIGTIFTTIILLKNKHLSQLSFFLLFTFVAIVNYILINRYQIFTEKLLRIEAKFAILNNLQNKG